MAFRDARAAQALCNRGSWHQDSNGAQYLMGTFNHVASPGSQEAHQIPSVWMQVRILLNDVNRIEHQVGCLLARCADSLSLMG